MSASASARSSRPAWLIAAHHWCEVEPVAIFESMHERSRNLIEPHRGAGTIVSGRIGNGFHRQYARAGIVDEGRAEAFTIGPRDEGQLRPARWTQTAALDWLTARSAKRRQSEIEHATQSRSSGIGDALDRHGKNGAFGQHGGATLAFSRHIVIWLASNPTKTSVTRLR